MLMLNKLVSSHLKTTYMTFAEYDNLVKLINDKAVTVGMVVISDRQGYVFQISKVSPWYCIRHSVSCDAKITVFNKSQVAQLGNIMWLKVGSDLDWLNKKDTSNEQAGKVETQTIPLTLNATPKQMSVEDLQQVNSALKEQISTLNMKASVISEHSPQIAEVLTQKIAAVNDMIGSNEASITELLNVST